MKGIVIAGPTGVGKTDLSIKLAEILKADIISADSAQVYKRMDIGTAKITPEEMQGIKHYMIDIVEPIKKYSVGDYQKEVDSILLEEEKVEKPVLLVGGTGLYINSITEGLSDLPSADEELRKSFENYSDEELFIKLKNLDEESANSIHMNNRKRVERALEVCILTGNKFSELSIKNIKNNNYNFLKICLVRDRENLYERINRRVDIMIESGLLDEVKALYEKYGEVLKKINIIGYSEIIDYIEEKITLEKAISDIKKNSRRYAKRQLTWFNNSEDYIYFDVEKESEEEILNKILTSYNMCLNK